MSEESEVNEYNKLETNIEEIEIKLEPITFEEVILEDFNIKQECDGDMNVSEITHERCKIEDRIVAEHETSTTSITNNLPKDRKRKFNIDKIFITDDVSVDDLKKNTFSKLSLHDKIVIKKKGRPIPNIIIHQTAMSKNKKYIRSFNSEWYKKIKWLCGCQIRNALFCFPCLLYGNDSVWTNSGFTNISRLKEKSERHQNSKKHMENVVSLSLLGHFNIAKQPDEDLKIAKLKHNEKVKKNRDILTKIIDYIKFNNNFEIALYGCIEDDSSENLNVFKNFINFIATFNSDLKTHLDTNSAFQRASILRELLQNMLEVCREQIISEIEKTLYLTVIVDDITDVSETAQLVIIFRYELQGVIYERFWGFFNPESVSADDISKCIINEIHKVLKNNSHKLIAHTYDDTNVIRSEGESVQYKIQEVFKNARYVHFYADQYNLMKHVCGCFKSTRLFFANLLGITTFFSKSSHRLTIYDKYFHTRFLQFSNNRWNFDIKNVSMIFENKDKLINCFEELQYIKTSNKTIQRSTGCSFLLKDKVFLFWLQFFHKIMPDVELLYNLMYSKNINSCKIEKALNKFYNAILEIQNLEFCKSASTNAILEIEKICDHICEEAKLRFTYTNHLIIAKLFYHENFQNYHKKLPILEIKKICNIYSDLVEEKLETELQIFYSRKEFHSFDGLVALLNLLAEENLSDVFSETIKLIKILLTIPMTTSEPKRCFITLEKIKSFLENNRNHGKLTAVTMIFIEKSLISEIKNFNERVFDKFCQAKNQRMDFIFI